jgi:hypothetical protein
LKERERESVRGSEREGAEGEMEKEREGGERASDLRGREREHLI